MTNSKTTKGALLTSGISLLLCFAMLLGTTFAWFTDSVTSANNIIKSGNLDVEFEYWDGDSWKTVEGASDILTNTLWEPGVTEIAYLRVANKGSLALKYQLGVNIISEEEGVNVAGETFKLSDSLMFGMIEGKNGETNAFSKNDAGRAEAIAALTGAKKISVGYTKDSKIVAGAAEEYFALVVYMPTTVSNEANHNGSDVPQIDLGINVFATQLANESDSFNDQYDAGAFKTNVTPETAQATIEAAQEGDCIYLEAGSYDTLVLKNADGSPKKGIIIEHDKPGVNPTSAPFNVGQIDLNGSEDITIRGIYFDIDKAKPVYKKDGSATGYTASIVGSGAGDNVGAKNIVIENCKFNATSNNHPDYIAICFEEQGKPTSRATNITVKGCMLDKQAFNFIRANYLAEGTVIVEKNSLPGGATHSALNFTGNAADLKIRNNSFGYETMSGRLMNAGWNPEKAMLGTSRQGSNKIKIEVTGNTFATEALVPGEGHVIELKNSYNEDNCDLIFEGNTFKAGLAGMTEDTVPCIWHN